MSNERQHIIEVPNIGAFTFRRRVMRDEFKIGAEYSRLTEGVNTPSQWLDMFATAFSTLKTLTAEAPAGWDLDAMEPDDNDTYRKILEVYGALRAAEARFRLGSGAAGESSGTGASGYHSALVPPPVRPAGE